MSVNIALPSVKYVFISSYLVVSGRRSVCATTKCRIFNCIDNSSKPSSFFNNVRNYSACRKPEEPPWSILFFGTDHFSLACLQPLFAKLNTGTLLNGLGVVSSPGSTIYKFAESEKLPIHTWPPDDDVLKNYDLGIVVSYGKLIPENIIKSLRLGILNVHGSLLPRWRGAAPIAYAIMNGDSETGVTIMRIKPHKFDIGDIVRQYRCSISPTEETPELTKRLAKHSGLLLMECIRDIPKCLDMASRQPDEGVTYAPKLDGKLSTVDWKTMSAQRVYNLYRAISYKYSLTTTWFGKPVKLYNVTLEYETMAESRQGQIRSQSSHKSALNFLNSSHSAVNQDSKLDLKGSTSALPGKVMYSRLTESIKVQCADGKWVKCVQFKVSNGPIMESKGFYNGYLSKKDEKDWFFV